MRVGQLPVKLLQLREPPPHDHLLHVFGMALGHKLWETQGEGERRDYFTNSMLDSKPRTKCVSNQGPYWWSGGVSRSVIHNIGFVQLQCRIQICMFLFDTLVKVLKVVLHHKQHHSRCTSHGLAQMSNEECDCALGRIHTDMIVFDSMWAPVSWTRGQWCGHGAGSQVLCVPSLFSTASEKRAIVLSSVCAGWLHESLCFPYTVLRWHCVTG